jgi:hypothetical protein
MEDYDFIGMVERMDESLVIMKMLLQLDMNDILYLSAKHGGGYMMTADTRGIAPISCPALCCPE